MDRRIYIITVNGVDKVFPNKRSADEYKASLKAQGVPFQVRKV